MRKITKKVNVGNLEIGGNAPISIQSMTNTYTQDIINTVMQIERLEAAGCEIVRLAVPDMAAAEAIKSIKEQVHIPLVADIHFDYRLALKSIESGIDKVRLNPGNISSEAHVSEVVSALKYHGIPLRIGVNSGSVDKVLLQKYGGPTPEAMVESALSHIKIVEDNQYDQIVVSIKSSSVVDTVRAYQLLSERIDYPLHIGVTEVGTLYNASIKSAMGLGSLLINGIGDTMRVSITGDPVEEIRVARSILSAAEIRQFGINIVSCPTCGRCHIDLENLVNRIETEFAGVDKHITLAIMGCAVNGPGEAREADIGIAGGIDEALIFKKGVPVKKLPYEELFDELKRMINEL